MSGSVYFDGIGDYLSIATNTALNVGSGNFTLEFWWNPSSRNNYQTLVDKNLLDFLMQTGGGDGKIGVYLGGSSVCTSSTAVTLNAWTHVALVRNSTTVTLYQNGASVASGTSSANVSNTAPLLIGTANDYSSNGQFTGYLSNFRLVKGTAVYTSAFTPPTSPLTAISGTSLLTCQSGSSIVDISSNAFTVTAYGNAVASGKNPFG